MMPLTQMACEVLNTADGREKTALSRRFAAEWFSKRNAELPVEVGLAIPPNRPARPNAPELLAPRDVPRRKTRSEAGRNALLHAVAHIELNAVDLHWDLIAQFCNTPMPIGYYDDWVKAADEERNHFNMMCDCLKSYSSFYAAMPAHAGMWRAAEDTANDFFRPLGGCPHGIGGPWFRRHPWNDQNF